MRKHAGLTIVTLLLLLVPALANAWTLTVKVAGGTPDSRYVSVAYGTVAPRIFYSTVSYLYPVGALRVTPAAGATSITFDNDTYTTDSGGTAAAKFAAAFVSPTSGNHTLIVNYATAQYTYRLSLAQAAGGMIYAQNKNSTWSSTGVSGLMQNEKVAVTIAADGTHKVTGYYAGDVVPANRHDASSGAGGVVSLLLPADNSTITPEFGLAASISATLFAPTSAVTGSAIILNVAASSNDNGLEYFYSFNGAPYPATGSPNSGYSYTPAAAGSFTVKAKVTSQNGGVTETPVTTIVIADAVVAANAGCVSCHSTQPSTHPITGLGDRCSGCHGTTPHDQAVATHAGGQEANCFNCHASPPHFGGNAFLKAQYVSQASVPVSCADCHGQGASANANQAILEQFATSAHGDPAAEAWIHYDWRSGNRSSCARCHAGSAFVAKLGNENDTTNVFQPGDILKPGEPLTCSACHANAGTGELRVAAGGFTINLKNGATVSYEVAGASTLCARCHSGRETGDSIKADTDTTGVRAFIDSHYQPAAGTLYNKAGYEYEGQSYDGLGSHQLLGATGQGPCVVCHMPGKNHSFVAAACATCHGVTAPGVPTDLRERHEAALNNLKLALEAKGIYYGAAHPFFFTAPYLEGGTNTPFTNWAGAYGAGHWKDTMGAAFNYNLLRSEKGAYAHNYNYAKKLITDSIDFLSDGTVNGQ